MSTGSGAAPTSTSSTLSRTRVTKWSVKTLAGLLNELAPLSPLVASRHTHQTGTLRIFERRLRRRSRSQRSSLLAPGTPRDGLICYVLRYSPDLVPGDPGQLNETDKPIVCAFVPGSEELHQRAIDTAAHLAALQALSREVTRTGSPDGNSTSEPLPPAATSTRNWARLLHPPRAAGRSGTARSSSRSTALGGRRQRSPRWLPIASTRAHQPSRTRCSTASN